MYDFDDIKRYFVISFTSTYFNIPAGSKITVASVHMDFDEGKILTFKTPAGANCTVNATIYDGLGGSVVSDVDKSTVSALSTFAQLVDNMKGDVIHAQEFADLHGLGKKVTITMVDNGRNDWYDSRC